MIVALMAVAPFVIIPMFSVRRLLLKAGVLSEAVDVPKGVNRMLTKIAIFGIIIKTMN